MCSGRSLWILLFWSVLLLILSFANLSQALKCYTCGTYPRDGTGSVTPCTSSDQNNINTCSPLEHFCLKYVNKNLVVKQCTQQCQEKVSGEEEEYCCAHDNCNGSQGLSAIEEIVFLSTACAALYQRMR